MRRCFFAKHFDVGWSRFNLGPTWGTAINDQLRVGASLLVSFSRYRQAILGSSIVETTAGASTTSSYDSLVSASSWDLATRLGATYSPTKRFTLGASVSLPLIHVLGNIRQTHVADSNDARSQWWGKGGFRALPPLEFRVGLGGEWQSVRFEADVFLTPGSSSYVRGELDREELIVQSLGLTPDPLVTEQPDDFEAGPNRAALARGPQHRPRLRLSSSRWHSRGVRGTLAEAWYCGSRAWPSALGQAY